jgi:hypothetical protein
VPTSDLCKMARCLRDGPDTRKALQKQAHLRDSESTLPVPLLNAQPHLSWWGTQGGSPIETGTSDPLVNASSR